MKGVNMDEIHNFRPKEAADYLRISESMLWNLVKDGKIKTVKLSKQVTIIPKKYIDHFTR